MKKQYQQVQRDNMKYRNILLGKLTKEEVIFEQWLKDNKIYYKKQKGFLLPFHRIVDFYIPKHKIIIEIDGGYHQTIIKKDLYKDKVWGEKGYKTIRIKNEEVNDASFEFNYELLKLATFF